MDQIIFSLLRTSIWGEEKFPLNITETTVDWSAVYQELRAQTVHNLPMDHLCRLDPAHKDVYLKTATQSISYFYTLMHEQQQLTLLFEEAGIPFVVLKGSAAAYRYPRPEYRSMGDIDVLVKPTDFDRAHELMSSQGYIPGGYMDAVERHAHFKKNNISYELHRFFALLNSGEQARAFDNKLYAAIDRAQHISTHRFTFSMLPDLENGLVLLAHIAQHLEGGLGLRQIVDWMMYADQQLTDSFWQNEFRKTAAELGLETLALTVTRMCQLYLGLRADIFWCKGADEGLCHELMQLTMDRGNFGRKLSSETQKSQNTLLAFRGVRQFFSRLQYRGCNNWTLLEKYPWFRPFAWLYQLFRYIYRGLKREHPIRQLLSDIRDSRKNDDLFTRLGIARHGEGFQTPKGTRW